MKVLIYKQAKGSKPTVFSREKNLKTAKKILSDKFMLVHELMIDEIVEGRDKLSKDGKTLELFNYRYWVEQDRTL
jgi:hypothetical protein